MMADSQTDVIRIGNCSGFMGDRFLAAKEMVEGGPIDVLTGDYLAEATMAALSTAYENNPDAGYVGNFVGQASQVMRSCLDKGIKIVVNAGGLNPQGLVEALKKIAEQENLSPRIAYIDGDDLRGRIEELQSANESFTNLDTGQPLADSKRPVKMANAYLGGWGIKEALDRGADIVIAARVTDASLVMGPAAWKFNWKRDDYDQLAGALVAGHIIECGPHATGGNYSFFKEVPSFKNIGYPIAEISADGSCIITKHEGTGGLVSTGTVTAQTLYETDTPAYLNPDVIAHFDSMKIEDLGNDRVQVSGVKGSAPPKTHKVCINTHGGYKLTVIAPLAGINIEAKARLYADTMLDLAGGRDSFDEVSEEIILSGHRDPQTFEESLSSLRLSVKSTDENKVNILFVLGEMELILSNIPGLIPVVSGGNPIPQPISFMVHWPALVGSKHIVERVHLDGETVDVQPTSQLDVKRTRYEVPAVEPLAAPQGERTEVYLGQVYGTRSGDKGGNANIGVWARDDEDFSHLLEYLTVSRLKALLPDTADCEVERYELPNIRALNFYIRGYLGEGVSASSRIDALAKSMGEYLGGRLIDVPEQIAAKYSADA